MRAMAMAALALTLFGGSAAAAGDAHAGQRAFTQCKACHSPVAGQNKAGPSLFGIVGRAAGTAQGFVYSPAMLKAKASGLVWDQRKLDQYLADSSKVSGLNHAVRVFDGNARQNVIAYLTTLK